MVACVRYIVAKERTSVWRTDARLGTSTIVGMRSVNRDQLDVPCRVTELPYREGVGEGTERRRSGTSVPRVIGRTPAGDGRGCQRRTAPVYKG